MIVDTTNVHARGYVFPRELDLNGRESRQWDRQLETRTILEMEVAMGLDLGRLSWEDDANLK